MAKRITHRWVTNQSFQWGVIGHNHKNKVYTIKNKATGEERTITRERLLEIVKEQEGKK
jgi:hypothetical protein